MQWEEKKQIQYLAYSCWYPLVGSPFFYQTLKILNTGCIVKYKRNYNNQNYSLIKPMKIIIIPISNNYYTVLFVRGFVQKQSFVEIIRQPTLTSFPNDKSLLQWLIKTACNRCLRLEKEIILLPVKKRCEQARTCT